MKYSLSGRTYGDMCTRSRDEFIASGTANEMKVLLSEYENTSLGMYYESYKIVGYNEAN